jgi:hypothetical protein
MGKNPPQLEELYDEIMRRIEQYPADADRRYAISAFRWLLYVQRTLDKDEFLAAVSTHVGSATTLLSLEQLLDLYCNLVIFDSTLSVFRFAHLSVREFLEKQPLLDAEVSHGSAAKVCLLSLITRGEDEETRKSLARWDQSATSGDVPSVIYNYAGAFWPVHYQAAGHVRLSGSLQALLQYL